MCACVRARARVYVCLYLYCKRGRAILCQRCLGNISNVRLIDDGSLSSFQGRSSSALSFHASLFQAIDGVMSLVLCPLVVSQAPQHFISSETQAACEGCFARQPICSVVTFQSGMSGAVDPQFSKVGVDH